jgi:hypothetical protein
MAPQFDRALRDCAAGCVLVRQGRGSHEIWHSPITKRNFAVPVGIPSRHTANAILRQARLAESVLSKRPQNKTAGSFDPAIQNSPRLTLPKREPQPACFSGAAAAVFFSILRFSSSARGDRSALLMALVETRRRSRAALLRRELVGYAGADGLDGLAAAAVGE